MKSIVKEIVDKNPFAGGRKVPLLLLCAVFLLKNWSCQSGHYFDAEISHNLMKMGSVEPELLIGEWDILKFAYTADGEIISNESNFKNNFKLKIPAAPTPIDDDGSGRWRLSARNSIYFICTLDGNLIDIEFRLSTYMNVPAPHEEYDASFALANAYSFVIKGNELIIYFPKIKDKGLLSQCTLIEGKNLLILKKVKP